MSIRSTIQATCDLSRPLTVTPLRHALVSGDNQGDVFEVAIRHNGEPADITGAGVVGYFIRQTDGSTVTITGTASGNKASVVLPEACYDMPGRFTLTIKVNQGGDRHAVYVAEGAVLLSSTDTMIDPGHVIPSLEELLAQVARIESTIQAAETATGKVTSAVQQATEALSQAETATQEASDAAQAATQAASSANDAADKANEVAGQIEGAVASATEAAEAAGQATEAATEAAASATSSAEKAEASAEKADGAADAATTAASSASEAAERANGVISAAEAAGESATSAAEAATQAAEAIDGLTVEAVDGEAAGATVSDVDGHKHIAFTLRAGRDGKDGKDGEKGDPGLPNIIKGEAYDSLEALQSGVPSPAEGDQYNVGEAPPYHVYRWTGSDWEDEGVTQGPKGEDGKDGAPGTPGEQGPAGKNGATFTPSVSPEGMLSWTNDQELPNPESVDIRGPKGDDGTPGINGENGEPGAPGKDGVTPHIDEESGNWFIGEEDTHVHAQGPKGEPGTTAGVPYSDEEPKPLGAATAGVSEEASRADHVHKLPTVDDIQAVPAERTINTHPLSEDVTLTAEDVQAVPTTRTINEKPLDNDISLTAADVGAVPGLMGLGQEGSFGEAHFTFPENDYYQYLAVSYDKAQNLPYIFLRMKDNSGKQFWLRSSENNAAKAKENLVSVWGAKPDDKWDAKPQVGGKNLLHHTNQGLGNGVSINVSGDDADKWTAEEYDYKGAKGIKVEISEKITTWCAVQFTFPEAVNLEEDTDYVLSFDYYSETALEEGKDFAYAVQTISSNPNATNIFYDKDIRTGAWTKKYAQLHTIASFEEIAQNLPTMYLKINRLNNLVVPATFIICNVKLEKGRVPTDWTPAIEELVPVMRKINNKPLDADVSLTSKDVGIRVAEDQWNAYANFTINERYADMNNFSDFSLGVSQDGEKVFCRSNYTGGTHNEVQLVSTKRTINGQTLDKDITIETANIEYSTVDLTAGSSNLETGKIYLVYE